MSDKPSNPYRDAPNSWPDRDESPFAGGGTNEGVQMPPFPDRDGEAPPTDDPS